MKTVSAYQCKYCQRYGKDKKRILKHEAQCFYNPRTRSCGTCIYLDDWSCRRGVVFEQEEGRRNPTLSTKCLLYENIEDVIYGQEDDSETHQTPF